MFHPCLAGWRPTSVCTIIIALQGCAENGPTAIDGGLSWDSHEMHVVKVEWQALQDAYSKTPEKIPGDNGKSKYGHLQRMCEQVFRKHIALAQARGLAESCDALPARIEDGFTSSALAFVVKRLTEAGDRKRLVALLSKRCPLWIDWPREIEFYLAAHDDLLPDAAVILGDAYLRCNVAETRDVLAAALRRGFDGFSIGGKDDAEFVANAMAWYFSHKSRLTLNGAYGGNDISPTLNPLFVGKPDRGSLPRATDHFWQDLRLRHEQFVKPRRVNRPMTALEGTWQVVESGDDAAPDWSANGSQLIFRGGILECFAPDGEKKSQFRVDARGSTEIEFREMPRSVQAKVGKWWMTKERSPPPATLEIYRLTGDTLRLAVPFHDQDALNVVHLTLQRVREDAHPRPTAADVPSGLSWHDSKMRELRAQWQDLQDACHKAPESVPGSTKKDKLRYTRRRTAQLFKQHFSQSEVFRLADQCDAVPVPVEERGFDEAVLAFLVKSLAEANERERLVEMLSRRCPTWIAWPQPIEHYLATGGRRLDEPFLVLGDAHTRCRTPETRKTLAAAIHRAFAGLNIARQNDAAYVDRAMRWYEPRKDELRVNGAYLGDETGSLKVSLFTDESISSPVYGGRLATRFARFTQSLSTSAQRGVAIALVCLLWLIHATIGAALSVPIVIAGRARAGWRHWEFVAALVVPFAVWFLLFYSHFAAPTRNIGNLAEPFLFALALPVAALLRHRLFRQPFWHAHSNLLGVVLIGLLAMTAVAVYLLAPPWVV